MSHAAVLLAGGKSSRMGRDKSALPVNGEPLWERQIGVLRATGPAELFLSGKRDGPYAGCGVEILADEFPGGGPLAGIASALRRCESESLLVLAVDMPAMTADFLLMLLEESRRTGAGVVPSVAAEDPKTGVQRLEPLAAIYPRGALRFAEECLRAGERRMETFIRGLAAQGLVTIRPVEREAILLFANWNTPEDVEASERAE